MYINALNPIDYDNVTAHVDAVVPDAAMDALAGVVDVFPRDGEPYRRVSLSRDVYVMSYPVRTKVSGSPHKHVHGESVGVFGPAEMQAFAEDVAGRLGLPLGAVLNGRVSRLDVSANFHVDPDVAEFLRLVSAPSQMMAFTFGTGSKVFKNGLREVALYDKVQKLLDQGNAALVPSGWEPSRVLRVEVRFRRVRKEFGRTVTVGDLCTQAFYEEAKARWARWASSVRVRNDLWAAPVGGRTVNELREGYAAAGVARTGGPDAATGRIDATRRKGEITSAQASRQRKYIVDLLVEGSTVHIGKTLADTFRDAVEAAAL